MDRRRMGGPGRAVPMRTGPAVARGERNIAIAAAVSRFGALALLLAGLINEPDELHRPLPLVLATLTAESVLLAAACLRTGVLRRSWALADAVCLAVLLWLAALPAVTGRPVGVSPAYNFTTVAVLAVGLAGWSLGAALGAAGLVAAANASLALLAGDAANPLWNAVPDSLSLLGATTVAWVIAWLLRRSAETLDGQAEAAVVRTAALARERERVRQGRALGSQLLATLQEVAARPDALDPVLRPQVEREIDWLRTLVESGLPDDDDDLPTALRRLVIEKEGAGLRVTAEIPAGLPRLAADLTAALAGAAREALTNVGKHAGVGSAELRVRVAADAVTVEIIDLGRGYDQRRRRPGTGQAGSIVRRMTDAGGSAQIESVPGRGTAVRLRAPLGEPPS